MTTPKFAMCDTRRPDGCYVEWERRVILDETADPRDYLFQDEDYREQDQERLDGFLRGDWEMVGIRACAHVTIVKNGHGFSTMIESAGLWGIESDSGEEYFREVFEDEKASLVDWLADLKMSTEDQA